jgi:hypothetical membrane protein
MPTRRQNTSRIKKKMPLLEVDKRYRLYARVAGLLLLVGGIQFMLGVVVAESQYPGYSTSGNTLSDMSGSCPSIDPENPMQCLDSVVLEPSATIFSSIVFVIGLTAAVSAYFIHRTLGGRVAPALLLVTCIGAMGVGVFPGNAGVAHGISALITFSAGGAAAITSFRILKESRPMQYISIALGSIALIVLLSPLILGGEDPFSATLGEGGAERLVAYPIVMWIIALAGYLLAASSANLPKGVIPR